MGRYLAILQTRSVAPISAKPKRSLTLTQTKPGRPRAVGPKPAESFDVGCRPEYLFHMLDRIVKALSSVAE